MIHNKIPQKLVLAICLIFLGVHAFSSKLKEYNVYLVPEKKATQYIKKFDNSLEKTNILEKYKTTPFIENHPAHLTLYLTSFKDKSIKSIKAQLATIAENTKPFYIDTTGFSPSKGGFVMLDIKNSQYLQNLSNKVIKELAKYRNKDYPIPGWVKFYPNKLESFKKYGSPNAFAEFDPHFSILAANLNSDDSRANFEKDFDRIIKNISIKQSSFKIEAIGFGETDINGQITKNLNIYKLSK